MNNLFLLLIIRIYYLIELLIKLILILNNQFKLERSIALNPLISNSFSTIFLILI